MSSHKRNILVGLTVLGAFGVLGWMIIQFGGRIGNLAAGESYAVAMVAPRVDGLADGSQVIYLGKTVGRVERMELADDRTSFRLGLALRPEVNVPANVYGVIRATNLISGGAAIDLRLDGADAQGSLREVADDRVLEARFNGSEIIPTEFSELAEEFRLFTHELRESGLVANVNAQVTKIGEVADALQEIVGDEQLRGDVKQSVASIREAADSAARVAEEMESFSARLTTLQNQASDVLTEAKGVAQQSSVAVAEAQETISSAGRNIDDLSKQLSGRLVKADQILGDIQEITNKINTGEGTAGLLVNDPRLYAQLVDNMRLLETTIQSSNRLIRQFEEEGIQLNWP